MQPGTSLANSKLFRQKPIIGESGYALCHCSTRRHLTTLAVAFLPKLSDGRRCACYSASGDWFSLMNEPPSGDQSPKHLPWLSFKVFNDVPRPHYSLLFRGLSWGKEMSRGCASYRSVDTIQLYERHPLLPSCGPQFCPMQGRFASQKSLIS